MLSVFKEVADWVGQSTNFPVTKLDWRILRVLLLAAGRGVVLGSTDSASILVFLLKFANAVESLIL